MTMPFFRHTSHRVDVLLISAVLHADHAAVIMALSRHARPNQLLGPPLVRTCRTLLQHSVLSSDNQTRDLLLANGADPMAVTTANFWPIPHLATLNGDRGTILALVGNPRANFDLPVVDPLTGEASTARDIAARKPADFANWFSTHFSLAATAAAHPPQWQDPQDDGEGRHVPDRFTRGSRCSYR